MPLAGMIQGQGKETVVCVVGGGEVSGLFWCVIGCTDSLFLSLDQVHFIGSNSGSEIREFELKQLSTGTQSPYTVENLDQMSINGKCGVQLKQCCHLSLGRMPVVKHFP